jgi:hypothetical protein
MLTVIASYYLLFAAMAGEAEMLVKEAAPMGLFVAAAVIGFRRSLWLVVAALAGHGVFDLVHGRLIDNPGAPLWWPSFCGAFDFAAAGALALRLTAGQVPRLAFDGATLAPEGFAARIAPHVTVELKAARECETSGDAAAAFHHLERAHVLGQASTVQHVRAHAHMLAWAWRRREPREAQAQLLRLLGAATKPAFGMVPRGNTGGGDVSAFKPLPIPVDLAARIAAAATPAPAKAKHR